MKPKPSQRPMRLIRKGGKAQRRANQTIWEFLMGLESEPLKCPLLQKSDRGADRKGNW